MIHRYFDIPGWFLFHDVYDRAVALFPSGSHFVEVGCWKGRSASYMAVSIANSGKDIRFDCVDTWKGSKDHLDKGIDTSELYHAFMRNMHGLSFHAIRSPSAEAAALYQDGSLDFVFLDASHEADDVRDDVLAWRPKLKAETGVLAGDDVTWESVRQGILKAGVTSVIAGVFGSWVLPNGQRKPWLHPVEKEGVVLRQASVPIPVEA